MLPAVLMGICMSLCSGFTAQGQQTDTPFVGEAELTLDQNPEAVDLDEVSRQLDNPLTRLWSLTFEDSFYVHRGDAIEGATPANTLFF